MKVYESACVWCAPSYTSNSSNFEWDIPTDLGHYFIIIVNKVGFFSLTEFNLGHFATTDIEENNRFQTLR